MFSFFRRGKKARTSQPAMPARKFVRRLPLYLERLEDRTLLSGVIGGVSNTDTWIGPNGLGGSGNWDVGSNWSNQSAPGYGGTAFISTSSAATITIQPGDNINVQSITTGSNDTLSFTGGSLTVIGGTSTLSGALDMTGGSLSANNAGTKLTVNGSTTITGANLSADNGATLSLPQLTSYVSNSSNFSTDGAGSVLDVSALTNVTQTGGWSVDVNGGEIDLSGLTSLSSTKGISINDNGTLLLSKLAAMDNVNLTVMRASSLALADLTNADGSSLSVNSGGSLSLPELVSYAANGSTFSADGSGSVLDVSALTTLTQNGNWYIDATNSGEINLDGLTSLNSIKSISVYDDNNSVLLLDNLVSMNNVYNFTVSGASLTLGKLTNADGSNFSVQSGGKLTLSALKSYAANGTNFSANGSGSLLDVSALTTLTQNGSWEINAANSGEINLSGLTSLNGSSADPIYLYDLGGSSVLLNSSLTSLTHVNATLDGTDQQVAEYWTSFTNGNLTVQKGASLSLANLISADGSNLSVSGGGSLSLPELTSYAANKTTFSVDGSGSLLDVSALKTLTQNNSWGISVTNSGEINLDGLTSLNSTKSISVYDSNNSVLLLDNLVSMNNVYNFTVSGAALTLAKLTNADGSSFSVQSGGSLSLPELTSYASNGSNFQAIGTNSVLDVSALTTLTQNGSWSIEASDGGEINLNGLTSLTSTQGISINDSGTLLLDNLASMDKVNLTVNVSSLTLPLLTDSGTSSIQLYGAALNLPVLTKGNIPLSAGTSLTIQGTAINMPANGASGATINVPSSQGLTITLQNNVNTLTDTTFNVGQGSNLVLTGGTYLGTTTFNVGQGATVDLTGGSQTTYGGVLTGSGAGTVLFSSGTLYPAVGGVTLNFTGNMFQWTGGAIEASVGDVTNLGTINLAGSNDKQIYADGTLFNYGTIIQTGNGNFDLHSDNISPTTLNNEAGGLYLLESDSGINNLGLGDNVLINAGIIRKTAGTGTSTFYIPSQGYISNTGTIEADSGTLFLDASSISQVASNTLTRGTWNALNGATLEFPNGTNITTNDANIRLDGSGAAIAALAGLNANNGTLSLTNGADFTTTGDLSNSGSLTVGAGSTLTVKGNYTQTAAGTLNDQIGGTPTSGQFGQVAVQKSANLDGNFNASLVNSYGPTAGQNFPVMTFASANGNFTHLTGLNPFFTESLNAANLELTDAATNAVSLGLSNVTAPTTATTGQQIAVNWQVNNSGSNDAAGNWQDSVYLSTTPTITSNSILLGSVTHSGGLAAGNSYNGSLTAAVPAAPPGYYYVLVQADSTYQEPVVNRANLTLTASTGQLQVSVPALTLGTPASGAFTAADQDQYYQVTVPSGGSLQVALSSTASSGALAVYVSQGTLPTTYNYQEAADFANQANQTVTVPQVTTGGTYYILVHSISGAAATAGFTLTANQSGVLSISGIGSSSAGNAGNATVEIDGANFTSKTTASLSLGATTIIASAIDFVSASQIFATFDLSGAATGNYTLSVQSGSSSAAAPTPFQVVTASAPALQVTLETPEYVRSGRTANLVISYTNTGNNDLVAPVLDINSTNANVLFSTPNDPNDFVQSAMLLAVAPNGHAGWLSPGQTGQITITILSNDTISGDQIPIQVGQLPSGEPLDLSLPPIPGLAGLNANVANIIFDNEKTVLGLQYNGGFTSDSFDYALAEAATYLGDLGETTTQVSDVGLLWSFLLAQADGDFPTSTLGSTVDAALPTPGNLPLAIDRTFQSSIIGRSTESLFGLGWTTSWQTFLSVDSSGNVTIDTGDSSIDFVSQVNGSFLDVAGEAGSLSLSNGVYTFTSTNGSQFVFFSQATNPPRDPYLMLSYVQDTNGNRITLAYNSFGELVTLTYSNPSNPSQPTEQFTLSYNGLGPVSQISDGNGNTWTYSYDPFGYLVSVTAPGNLTTTYSYDTTQEEGVTTYPTFGALLSITNPDGSQENFTYDPTTGRLTGTSQNGGADPISISYLGEGEVGETDANGNQTITWFNDLGLPARIQDAQGAISSYQYDANGGLIGSTDSAGNVYQYSYDANGNLTQSVNPLGQVVRMTYGPLDTLTSLTDAAGNTTQYKYDSAGNLLSITYPDGTSQAFSYDPVGNLTETVLQNGDPINYQNNAEGLVTKETFADGTSQTFSYDSQGDLLTAQTYDASGNLTGTTTLTYNAAFELTSITYPNGQSLTFTYNAAGQRVQSVDQSGYIINYSYDALGRLSELTDGSGNLIVQYTYNNLGQLVKKVNGNGTYTTYAYDPDGDLTQEVNYANSSGTTVNSSFTYTYNTLEEQTSVTDASGNVTTYGYDALGQLTQVTLPDGTSITYVYNAAGDRTEVLTNGVPTNYASNADNEITQAGSTTYTYDQNGNLRTATNSSGTTTYTYNDLNQLVSIASPDGSVQTFQYSPLGFLVGTSTTSGGTTSQTNYLVDPSGLGNVVASYNGSGSLIAHYNYGLGLVSQTGPSGTGYYDFDAGGNTVGITGSSGTYVNQYSYLPFGETTTVSAALPNPFTFAGQVGVMQIASNLFSMRARDYLPTTGQFTSPDPLNLAGGDTNLRRYVGNNPVNGIDPSGLDGSGPQMTDDEADALAMIMFAPMYLERLEFDIDSLQSKIDKVNKMINNLPNDDVPRVVNGGYYEGSPWYDVLDFRRNRLESQKEALEEKAGKVYIFALAEMAGGDPSPKPLNRPGIKQQIDNSNSGVKSNTKASGKTSSVSSHDPNALDGPAGYGTQGYIQDSGTWPYTIDFENDGSAAAQDVTVTEQLDPNLDWSTFQLGSFGWGPVNITVPAGLTQYQTTVSYQNSDGSSLNVLVKLNFNVQTGLLTVTFTSLDPLTGQAPTGVFDGFLYPEENDDGLGQGYVQYTVQPKANLSSGTAITQQASVVFDTNPPLLTDKALNTIDATTPTSSVSALPATESSPSFTVGWSGSDVNGPGIASYDIYVSDNGGAFTPWLTNTTQTSATYTGQTGHTYAFYSVATDFLGLTQPTPTSAQASTFVQTQAPTTTTVTSDEPSSSTYGQTVTFTATVSTSSSTAGTPTGSVQFQIDGTNFGSPVTLVDGQASITTSTLSATSHNITANYTSDSSNFANSSTLTSTTQIVNPLAVTLTGSRTYDDTPTAAASILTVSNLVSGDNLTLSGSATLTGANVGNETISSFAGLNLGGSSASNYTLTDATGSVNITAAPLTISAVSVNKTYDGTTNANATPTVKGLQGTDTITGLTESFDSPNAGTQTLSVNPGYIISDGNDYIVTLYTASGTISQAQAIISIQGVSVTYDGNAHAASGTATGVENPNPVNLSSLLSLSYSSDGGHTFTANAPVNAGDYEVYYTFAGNTNYQAVTTYTDSGKAIIISQAQISYTIGNDTQAQGYPANLAADLPSSFSTGINGETLDITYSSTGDSSTAGPGSYAITGSFSNGTGLASNYIVTPTDGTLTVLGSGVRVVGSTLWIVGGTTTNDHVHIDPVGASKTGSTGVQVDTTLNGVRASTTYTQSFSAIYIFLYGGNDDVHLAPSLTIDTMVNAGNGRDNIHLGDGNNTVTLGDGQDNILAGDGNNKVTAGKGDDNVVLGNGTNAVTLGDGNDNVISGNGNSLVNLGNGRDNVVLGDGSNAVTLGDGNDNVTAGGSLPTPAHSYHSWTDGLPLDMLLYFGGFLPIPRQTSNGAAAVVSGNNTIMAGKGNDTVWLFGNGNNTVTLGDGYDSVFAGDGNNNLTLGNGDDYVNVGNGNNAIVEGNGQDNINAGNGDNLIVAGLGRHDVRVGDGSNILIDGSVQLPSGDSLSQILNDWTIVNGDASSSNIATIRSILSQSVTYNTLYANTLYAGRGLDWFWATDTQDHLNVKKTDLLN